MNWLKFPCIVKIIKKVSNFLLRYHYGGHAVSNKELFYKKTDNYYFSIILRAIISE